MSGGVVDSIRVLIADDHEIVRRGLRSLLATVVDIEVIGEAGTGADAVAMAIDAVPDVVLLDLNMPAGNGIDATRDIAAALPSVAIVILTMYDDDDSIDAALRAGSAGTCSRAQLKMTSPTQSAVHRRATSSSDKAQPSDSSPD